MLFYLVLVPWSSSYYFFLLIFTDITTAYVRKNQYVAASAANKATITTAICIVWPIFAVSRIAIVPTLSVVDAPFTFPEVDFVLLLAFVLLVVELLGVFDVLFALLLVLVLLLLLAVELPELFFPDVDGPGDVGAGGVIMVIDALASMPFQSLAVLLVLAI